MIRFIVLRWTLFLLCILSLSTEPLSQGRHGIDVPIPQLLPQLRVTGRVPIKPASCEASTTPKSEGLELVKRTTLVSFTTPTTYLTLLSAGKFVALHFPSNAMGTPKITIHVWSKSEGDGPFEKVCDRIILPDRLPVAFEVENPKRLSGSIWRLEFTVEGRPGVKTPPTPVEVFRAVGSDFDPDLSAQHAPWHEALG